jgi:hypothetical protein
MDHGVYCKERRVRRERAVTAPAPRGTQRKTSAGEVAVVAAAAGVSGVIRLIKTALVLFGVLVIGLGIWGYQRAHTPEFKMECAAHLMGFYPMSFPDSALCSMFYSSSGSSGN